MIVSESSVYLCDKPLSELSYQGHDAEIERLSNSTPMLPDEVAADDLHDLPERAAGALMYLFEGGLRRRELTHEVIANGAFIKVTLTSTSGREATVYLPVFRRGHVVVPCSVVTARLVDRSDPGQAVTFRGNRLGAVLGSALGVQAMARQAMGL